MKKKVLIIIGVLFLAALAITAISIDRFVNTAVSGDPGEPK